MAGYRTQMQMRVHLESRPAAGTIYGHLGHYSHSTAAPSGRGHRCPTPHPTRTLPLGGQCVHCPVHLSGVCLDAADGRGPGKQGKAAGAMRSRLQPDALSLKHCLQRAGEAVGTVQVPHSASRQRPQPPSHARQKVGSAHTTWGFGGHSLGTAASAAEGSRQPCPGEDRPTGPVAHGETDPLRAVIMWQTRWCTHRATGGSHVLSPPA